MAVMGIIGSALSGVAAMALLCCAVVMSARTNQSWVAALLWCLVAMAAAACVGFGLR